MQTVPSPATPVELNSNPVQKGIVLNEEPQVRGPRIKVLVKWDNGSTAWTSIQLISPSESKENNDIPTLLDKNIFGKKNNLNKSLIHYRISGALDNIIYSLNITNTTFFPYQFRPLLTFLNSPSKSLLIADEVGLGKTIEAGLIWTELKMREQSQRLLVVCPSSLCEKWEMELLTKFNVHATIVNAQTLLRNLQNFETRTLRAGALIVSIDAIRPPKSNDIISGANALNQWLESTADFPLLDMLIVDEAHHIRNKKTARYKAISRLRPFAKNTLFLSATPIQTSNENLFTLLNLFDPDTFPYPESLERLIEANAPLVQLTDDLASGPISERAVKRAIENYNNLIYTNNIDSFSLDHLSIPRPTNDLLNQADYRLKLINQIKRFNPLDQYVTRTLKNHVQHNHTVRDPRTVSVSLSTAERIYYDRITQAVRDHYERYCQSNPTALAESVAQQQMASSLQASFKHWQNLQKPEFLDPDNAYSESDSLEETSDEGTSLLDSLQRCVRNFTLSDELLMNDSKLKKLVKTIKNYQKENGRKKILLFSFYKKTLAYLNEKLALEGIRSVVVSGDIPKKERLRLIEDFKDNDADILLSSEVVSEGLDLQFISCLINYDLPWNPAKIEQRIGRIDRIGQAANKILIFNFIYEDTIEAKIYYRLLNRLNVFSAALGQSGEVLGEKIKNISKRLFLHTLTPREEEELLAADHFIDETEKANHQEAANSLMIYDLVTQKLKDVQDQGRFISSEDLILYVDNFCRQDKDNSRLIPINVKEHLYCILLSPRMKATFEEFLFNLGEACQPTRFFSQDNLQFRFLNKQGIEPWQIERITQNHPLIQFISSMIEQEESFFYPVALTFASEDNAQVSEEFRPGLYCFRIEYWSFEANKTKKGILSYAAIHCESGEMLSENDAERLVNKASMEGIDWYSQDRAKEALRIIDDDLEDHHQDRYGAYRQENEMKAKQDIAFKIHQFETKIQEYERELIEFTGKYIDNKILKLKQKTTENKISFIRERIESARLSINKISSNFTLISAGRIYIAPREKE